MRKGCCYRLFYTLSKGVTGVYGFCGFRCVGFEVEEFGVQGVGRV